MPLPASWIDALFARMQIRYAQSFERNYAGMDMAVVKADWAEVLDGVSAGSISYALVNLPLDWPPNAMQFHALCVRGANERREPREPQLPGVKADPERVAAELSRLRSVVKVRGPKQWAFDLQARENAGEKLNPAQRTMWRAALNAAFTPGESDDDGAAKVRTAELQRAAKAQAEAYLAAHPDAAQIGWTQEERDTHQRLLQSEGWR